MATATRIYLVTNGDTQHLVRAGNKSQAVNHIARATIAASVATQDDLIALAGKVPVQDAIQTSDAE